MLTYEERLREASIYRANCMDIVSTTPEPKGHKFPRGSRVKIKDDLGQAMDHFPKGKMATVLHTYAHAFGGYDVKSYCLDVDLIGEVAWYEEWQLSLEEAEN